MASGINFTIFNDNQDDQTVSFKSNKPGTKNSCKPGQTKRAALGTLTNIGQNAAVTRKQPSRVAKQQVHAKTYFADSENVDPQNSRKQCTAPTFPTKVNVRNDDISTVSSTTDDSNEVTFKSVTKPAFSTTLSTVEASIEDSPMVLDTSICSEESIEFNERAYLFAQYDSEIYDYLRESEVKYRPKPGYITKQPSITLDMRRILVDWLIEVAEEYKMHRETIFLAINYIDRFLSVMSVQRDKLQLVGAACMFIAAKFEEIYPPEVQEFVYITDDTYTKRQVLRMEHLVLKVLNFYMSVPTANFFCERLIEHCNYTDTVKAFAMYVLELTLLDVDLHLSYLPSMFASAAVCFSSTVINGAHGWALELENLTHYTRDDLMPCMRDMHTMCLQSKSLAQQAVEEKYSKEKYFSVSTMDLPCVALLFSDTFT